MRIDPILPDTANGVSQRHPNAAGFAQLVDAAGAQLDRADAAEAAFAQGRGGLAEMVVERARADVSLSVAVTGAQRAAQALNSVLGMQI